MRLRTLLSLSGISHRLRFLARCLHDRELLEWLLDHPRFAHQLYHSGEMAKRYLNWVGDDVRLAQNIYEARDQLRDYFACKWDLGKMAFQEGTVFPEEQPLLRRLVEAANSLPGPIIEIGTLFGGTTTLLALWKSPEKKIVTVDNYSWNPWQISPDAHRNLTSQFLQYLSLKGEVDVICQDKQAFYDAYSGEPPALVFLDADHGYEATKADIRWAKHVGAAIICGHDHAKHCPGVIRAVEEEGGTAELSHTVWALRTAYWEQCDCDQEKRLQLVA